MKKFGIGQAVRRSEDRRFVTGHGRYLDDIDLPGQACGWFLRAPLAHAAIRRLDTAAAAAAPGVVGIVTGADLAADGIGTIPCPGRVRNRDGSRQPATPRPALAQGRVRHVGDPVALVVADTADRAMDAAELIDVDYEPLPVVTDPVAALADGAPQIWDEAPGNQAFDWELGDAGAVAAAFARAAHVISLDLVNNRVVACPMEDRACLAAYDTDTGRFTLHVSCQGVHDLRDMLAEAVFRLPPDRFHVICPDVGGGFGMKIFLYPEYVATLYAARRLGRPVKWTAERTEAFVSDDHGRDAVSRAELALDADGRFLALKVDTVANLGAYLSNFGPFIATAAGNRMLCGLYRMEAVHARVRGVYTNTQPVDAYRGAGRPEAAYLVERMADLAARRLDLSPAEIRRRNFIPPEAMPYRTATGLTYDSGEFACNLDDALALADADGFPARRRAAEAIGRLRGIGLSAYVEASAGFGTESPTLRVARDGRVTVLIGTQSNGQGHETAYKQVVAEHLGVAPDRIDVVQGDTDRIATGEGTGGSRSLLVGGVGLAEAALKVREAARVRAADLLEAAAADVAWEDDRFVIVGTDRALTLAEVAAAAEDETAFAETGFYKPAANTYPNGVHVCEVEIDPDTGHTEVVAYTVVDDMGRVFNPLLLTGQIHGGVAQGLGQALLEHVVFDPDSGQLLSASFMDYALPHARSLPFLTVRFNEVPCRTNPLGIKGAGEAGAVGAPPAAINAVVDALDRYGVEHVDMPATPARIWDILHRARTRAAAE